MNFHIQWTDSHWWVWVLVAMGAMALVAAYNLRVLSMARDYWGDRVALNTFSPQSRVQSYSLWTQWVLFVGLLVIAFFGPNISALPEMAEQGAIEWQNVFDVSPSQAAEDTRAFYGALTGERDPGTAYQWGTRLDTNKAFFKNDLLPQITNNKAGIITVEGAGYNMWDITSDLAPTGAFMHMLNQFVQIGAAPGGGCDYTSGLQAALDEFDLIGGLEKKAGDNAEKVRFIALWTDGGFTGDVNALNKVLDEMIKRQIRLLIVNTAGASPVSVPKYDVRTHKRNGESYKGLTASDPKLLQQMVARMKGLGTLIMAPPGTKHVEYSIPQKAGGRYERPTHSNLKPYFLAVALALFLSITVGGGGLPRARYFLPQLRGAKLAAGLVSIKNRFANRTN